MKTGWKTLAIGRHLIDVPEDAKLIQQWKYASARLEALPPGSELDFKRIVASRERELRNKKHDTQGTMFIERVEHAGGVTLISWEDHDLEILQHFDTYFRAGSKAIKYWGQLSLDRKAKIVKNLEAMSAKWHALEADEIPEKIGFVAGDMLQVENIMNSENWNLTIGLAGKPDVSLTVSSFVVGKVSPEKSLRRRAGGIVAGMLGLGLGLIRLRNRERPVGPIQGEEILVAGTQNGKRSYGFKWETQGKANSLAEPQINVALEVGESAYETNAQSFASDEEALALWDTLVDSIRLRPGAAG